MQENKPEQGIYLWENVKWGIKCGTYMAAGISVVAIVPIVLYSYPLVIIPTYFVAGFIGGALTGVLRPLGQWRLGAVLIGSIDGIITYGTVGIIVMIENNISIIEYIVISLCLGTIIGGIVGFIIWKKPKEK